MERRVDTIFGMEIFYVPWSKPKFNDTMKTRARVFMGHAFWQSSVMFVLGDGRRIVYGPLIESTVQWHGNCAPCLRRGHVLPAAAPQPAIFARKAQVNNWCTHNDLHDSVHLFLNCEQSSLFWKRFKDLVKKLYYIDFTCNVYTLISGYNLENKHFAMYAKYAVYVSYIYAENNKVLFHEFSIFSIFNRLVRNRLNIEKYCKDKFLCVLKIL